MKSVLISIQPKWVEKIANGEKTIEVRKTAPKCGVPFKCYIYCTKPSKKYQTVCGCMVLNSDQLYKHPRQGIKYGDSIELMSCGSENYSRDNFLNGKVIGEFVCDKVYEIVNGKSSFFCNGATRSETNLVATQSCLDFCDMAAYLGDKNGYAWHISDLKIYDKPKELSEFYYCCKEMKANEPRAGKYVSLSCYACRRNALKRTEDYSEYNNMLGYICKRNITRPPQNWYYVEEL